MYKVFHNKFILGLLTLVIVFLSTNAFAVHNYLLKATTYNWIQVDKTDADVSDYSDDSSFSYSLPWSFPYGDPSNVRTIVNIVVGSNGIVTLQETGETSYTEEYQYPDCSATPPDAEVTNSPALDLIFANHTDLDSSNYGYYAVKAYQAGDLDSAGNTVSEDVVVILWETETYDNADSNYLNKFEVLLFPDGRIIWNYDYFQWTGYNGDPYSGLAAASQDHSVSPRWNSLGCASTLGFDTSAVSEAGGTLSVQEAYVALPNPQTLTVTKTGQGSGTVTSSIDGIQCGSDCSETYNVGTTVTLTATANEGSLFTGWSGNCNDIGNNQAQVVMNSDSTCTAQFVLASSGDNGGWDWGCSISSKDTGADSAFVNIVVLFAFAGLLRLKRNLRKKS